MNSKNTTLLIASILALTLFSGSISIGNVYATGNMDDEEEEEAIEELQNYVEEIKNELQGLTLNLEEGLNNVAAICPSPSQEQEPEPNVTEPQTGCNPIPEPVQEPPQTVIPPVTAEPEQNETQTGCNPIPEPTNETQPVLEPIICPINGELLGYLNTTSGEQLPISAGNETTQEQEFLPPIEVPQEEPEEQQTAAPEVPQQECNVTAPSVEEQPITQPTEPVEDVEFDNGCGCFVKDTDGDEAATDF